VENNLNPTNLTVYLCNQESLELTERYIISDSKEVRVTINNKTYLRARRIVGRLFLYKLEQNGITNLQPSNK
jgi:hypothetical protein